MLKIENVWAAGLRTVTAVARQVDEVFSTGSLENARAEVQRAAIRSEMRHALSGGPNAESPVRRSA